MASFEGAHGGPVSEAVREWRWGKFAPLYVAGILAGIGAGFAIATWPSEAPTTAEHVSIQQPLPSVDLAFDVPIIALPEGGVVQPNPATTAEFPLEWYPEMEPAPVVIEPIAPAAPALPATQPVAQAPLVKPAAPAPAAPAPAAPAAPAAAPAATGKPNFHVPAVSGGPASFTELDLLALINAERTAAGLAPYVLDAGLSKVARTRSQQLIDQDYFGHRDPFGYSMYVELLAYFGFTSYAWAGENLAMNNWPVETAADEAIRGLMNSPTHRANILAGDFYRIGIGEITVADGRHFFTMIFLG